MPPASNRAHRRRSRRGARRDEPPAEGAVRAKLPQRQAPQLSAVADEPPEGADWINEIKFDGYRLLCWLDHGKVRVVTRNGLDWTDRLPAVARAVEGLRAETALVDGELVALDKKGASSFPALQAALSAGKDATLHLFLFDLLHLDGWDLRACKLLDRKRVLSGLSDWGGMLRYSDHHVGDAADHAARGVPHGTGRHHLQAGGRPVSRRTRAWLGEGEMPRARGIRRAGVDTAWRQPQGTGLAARGLLRSAGRAALRRRRGHGFLRRRACAAQRTSGRTRIRPAEVVARCRRSAAEHHKLGAAGTGRRGAVRHMVGIGPGASRGVSRSSRGQDRGGGGA